VECLRIGGLIQPENSNRPVKLPNLLFLHVTDAVNITSPFTANLVETPNLQELEVDIGGPGPYLDYQWHQFLTRKSSIKKLTIPARLVKQVRGAPNVEDLTVRVTKLNDDKWVLELADNDANGSSAYKGSRICPNLRTITIIFEPSSIRPSNSVFNKLFRSRCIPIRQIDDELYTETGYKALEQLVLRFPGAAPKRLQWRL
jgi:hypothetical protein